VEDLRDLCRELNQRGAKYVVVAASQSLRQLQSPDDAVDLVVDASLEMRRKFFSALSTLPDNAVRELQPANFSNTTSSVWATRSWWT